MEVISSAAFALEDKLPMLNERLRQNRAVVITTVTINIETTNSSSNVKPVAEKRGSPVFLCCLVFLVFDLFETDFILQSLIFLSFTLTDPERVSGSSTNESSSTS